MVRLLLDDFSDGHQDLFLKIDTWPSVTRIADSYFLPDFFKKNWDETRLPTEAEVTRFRRRTGITLLNYWIWLVEEAAVETYLPWDLADQGIGAMHLKKTRMGYAMKLVSTTDLMGCGELAEGFGARAHEPTVRWYSSKTPNDPEREWLFSKESLIVGFRWSIDRIRQLP